MRKKFINSGFTLIELLVVISIIGIIAGLSFFGLQGARESARNANRKSDLELMRSGLEIYKADCLGYPASLGTTLVGDDSTLSCSSSNTYIPAVPLDPNDPVRTYRYSSTGTTYEICAALEDDSAATVTCGGSSNCGETCNYKVTSP